MLQVIVFLLGLWLVISIVCSALRTFVLPRSAQDRMTNFTFRAMWAVFRFRMILTRSYAHRDRIMAFFVSFSLLVLLLVWLLGVMAGYVAMFWALGVEPFDKAISTSGSSLFTLGFTSVDNTFSTALAFSEATLGLVLVALLISYLPTMYGAFSRRETLVTLLEVRAGSPPSAVELLKRFYRIGRLGQLSELWVDWELWFADVEESHTSFAMLTFFRSTKAERCWVTAAGTVLDAAALTLAIVDIPIKTEARICLHAGFHSLQHILDYFQIEYDPDPQPDDPISISRAEFEAACDDLAAAGLPLKADREQAWRDFSGWRVNYDTPLLALAVLAMAAPAPWSSDKVMKDGRVLPGKDLTAPRPSRKLKVKARARIIG